jgi:hypothetical protein
VSTKGRRNVAGIGKVGKFIKISLELAVVYGEAIWAEIRRDATINFLPLMNGNHPH